MLILHYVKKWQFGTEHGTFNETGSSVIALDLKTGKQRWSYGTKFRINSPLLYANGHVVAYDVYGNIFCLKAATGQLVWQINHDTEGLPPGTSPQPHMGPWDEQSMPSSKDDHLFLREMMIICSACRFRTDKMFSPTAPGNQQRNGKNTPNIPGHWLWQEIIFLSIELLAKVVSCHLAWQEQKIWQKVNVLYGNNLWLFAKSLSPAGQARRWTFATDSIKRAWFCRWASKMQLCALRATLKLLALI